MAVVVRRWGGKSNRLGGGGGSEAGPWTEFLGEASAGSKVSLDRQVLAVSSPGTGDGEVTLWSLNADRRPSRFEYPGALKASFFLWRAIRQMPSVPLDAHIPVPHPMAPSKRVGDPVLVTALPGTGVQFTRLSSSSPPPPGQLRRRDHTFIGAFAAADEQSGTGIGTFMWTYEAMVAAYISLGVKLPPRDSFAFRLHAYSYDTDSVCISIFETVKGPRKRFLRAISRVEINAAGVHLISAKCVRSDEIREWKRGNTGAAEGSSPEVKEKNAAGVAVRDIQLEGHFLWILGEDNVVMIWAMTSMCCLVATVDVGWVTAGGGRGPAREGTGGPKRCYSRMNIAPDCASFGLGYDARSSLAVIVVNLNEYFRARPCDCDWDTLGLSAPLWAAHGLCEGWHDVYTAGRPMFARATKREMGEESVQQVFPKVMHRNYDPNVAIADRAERAKCDRNRSNTMGLLESTRIGVAPRNSHWHNRYNPKRSPPPGLHLRRSISTVDAVSRKRSPPEHALKLLGEEDKLLQSITGADGYGGHGLDTVYGVSRGVGVQVPSYHGTVHQYGLDVPPERLPAWNCRVASVERLEPTSDRVNSYMKPKLASLNGFTLIAQRPTYARPSLGSTKKQPRSRRGSKTEAAAFAAQPNGSDEGKLQKFSIFHESSTRPSTLNPPNCSETYASTEPVGSKTISSLTLNPRTVILATRKAGGEGEAESPDAARLTLVRFTRGQKEDDNDPGGVTVTLPPASVPFAQKNHAWYYIHKDGINAVIFPSSTEARSYEAHKVAMLQGTRAQQHLVNKMIVFSLNEVAKHLCTINSWFEQAKRISIIALEIGLVHHELPVVEKSLKSLEGDLRLQGNRMLMHYIRTNWATFQDRNSFNRLLRVAQDFITRLIDSKTKALQIDTGSSYKFATNIMFATMLEGSGGKPQSSAERASLDILQLMNDLAEVREIEFYLNHRKQEVLSGHDWPKIVDSPSNETKLPKPQADVAVAGHFPLPQVSQSIQMINITDNSGSMRVLPIPSMAYNWGMSCWEGNVHNETEWVSVALAQQDDAVLNRSLRRRQDKTVSVNEVSSGVSHDNVVVSNGIDKYFLIWGNLHDEEIVRRCLLNSCVSAALSFLAARRLGRVITSSQHAGDNSKPRKRSLYMYHVVDGAAEVPGQSLTTWELQESGSREKRRSSIVLHKSRGRHMHGVAFDWFRYVGGRHVYEKLDNDNSELFLATLMLRNLGENVSEFFKDMAFQTSRRSLRWRLIRHLSHTCGIGAEEMETIEFIKLLEALYPNGCYTSEYQRRWSNKLNGVIPLWDFNWVGKRTQIVEDDVLKRWPAGGLGDESDPSYRLGIGEYTNTEVPVRPLAPQDSMDSSGLKDASRGVGCGYIVKIDLAEVTDDAMVDKGYTTDDTESDDDTLAAEEYMHISPPSRHVETADKLLEKWINCGDVQDLGAQRIQHQPGAAQHVVARDGPQHLLVGSGYYDRRGNGQNTNARSANGHWSRSDDNEASDVKTYRTKVCSMCLQHRPSAPMVPWMRNRVNNGGAEDSDGAITAPRRLQRHSSLDYPGTADIGTLRNKIKKLSDTIAVWRVHYARTGDEAVATYFRQAEEKRSILEQRLDVLWRDSVESAPSSKGTRAANFSVQSTPMWMPWVDDGSVAEEEGYLHIALAWAHSWDCQTRERVLIERGYRLEERSTLAYLPYFVAHNDWRGVVRWINNVSLTGGSVDSYGRFEVHDKDSAPPLLVCLVSFVMSTMDRATHFMRELIIVEFAKRGIFLPAIFHGSSPHRSHCAPKTDNTGYATRADTDTFAQSRATDGKFVYELKGTNSPTLRRRKAASEKLDFSRLMQVLCKCELLFLDPNRVGNFLSLEALLPVGKPSPFHRYFIDFCIQKGFLHVLREYLDHYQLGMDVVSLKALQIYPNRPWAKLLLTGRIGHTGRLEIFEAAVHNGLFCLQHWTSHSYQNPNQHSNKLSFPINAMLDGDRPLMAIGTLMYAPVDSLASVMYEEGADLSGEFTQPWNVSRSSLQRVLKRYPSLHNTIFHNAGQLSKQENASSLQVRRGDIMTWKKDVSLFDLLSDTVPFSLDAIFGKDKVSAASVSNASIRRSNIKHFSSNVLTKEAYVEYRGALYYLSKGWPMQAFHHMFANNPDGTTPGDCSVAELPEVYLKSVFVENPEKGRDGLLLRISPRKASSIRDISRRATLFNLLKTSVLAASSCFLDLCSLESVRETLQVDAEAATRIYEWRCRVALKDKLTGKDDEETLKTDILHNVADLFISFPENKDPEDTAVNKALALLGEATRDLVGDVTNTDSGAVLAWKLVSVFCRVHGLKTSIALLQELARRDDCITFLHEAQRERFMPNEVVDIVLNNFTDPCLRDHLYIVAQNMAAAALSPSSEDPSENNILRHNLMIEEADAILEGETSTDDIFDILFDCARHDSPGLSLLDMGLSSRRPQLAVLATCFPETPALDCLVTWLAVQKCCKDVPLAWLPWSDAQLSSTASPTSEPEPLIKLTTVIGRHNCSLQDFQVIISWLCRRYEFSILRTAFRIFDPDNIVLRFLQFYETFRLRQYKTAGEHMRAFVTSIKNSNYTLDGGVTSDKPFGTAKARVSSPIGNFLIAKQIAEDEVSHLLDVTVKEESPFQCEMLLSILASAEFSDECIRLNKTFSILQKVRLAIATKDNIPTSIIENVEFLNSIAAFGVWTSPEKVLELLIEIEWFDDARLYATGSHHGLGTNTPHEVTAAEVGAQLNRLRSSFLWTITSERVLFWERCMDLFQVHDYPNDRAGYFFGNLTSKYCTELSGAEHVQLLKMSQQLLNASANGTDGEGSSEFFDNLETQILIISIGNDISAGSGFASLPSVFDDASPETVAENINWTLDESAQRHVELVVTELINRELLDEANRVCKRYNYSSNDLAKVREAIDAVMRDEANPLAQVGTLAAKSAGERIQTVWNIKQQLRVTYDEILSFSHEQTITMLLSLVPVFRLSSHTVASVPQKAVPKSKILSICSDFISHFNVEAEVVSTTFAQFFFNSIVEVHETIRQSGAKLNDWRVEDLEEYVVGVAQAPRSLGTELLKRIEGERFGDGHVWHRCEAELLIIAHFCHVQACNVSGIQACIKAISSRAKTYARLGNYRLLVRLLVSTKEFRQLEFIFDIVAGQRKLGLFMEAVPEHDQDLKYALDEYMRANHSSDMDRLVATYKQFEMHREVGELLRDRALARMGTMAGTAGDEMRVLVVQLFIQAAKYFLKEDCFQKAFSCLQSADGLLQNVESGSRP